MLVASTVESRSGGGRDKREKRFRGGRKKKSRSGLVPPFNLSTHLVSFSIESTLKFASSLLLF